MSRTYKDAPRRVKEIKAGEVRRAYDHEHKNIGRVITRRVNAVVDGIEIVPTEFCLRTKANELRELEEFLQSHGVSYEREIVDARMYFGYFPERFNFARSYFGCKHPDDHIEISAYDYELVKEYADHCTMDEELVLDTFYSSNFISSVYTTKDGKIAPCVPNLVEYHFHESYCGGPGKNAPCPSGGKSGNAHRSRNRDNSRNIIKAYREYGDIIDEEYDKLTYDNYYYCYC